MNPIEKHIVGGSQDQLRFLDFCLGNLDMLNTRKAIKKAIKNGQIKLNGQIAETSRWIRQGDIIELFEAAVSTHKIFPLKLNVLYEDDDIAIIFKPAGYEVSGNKFKTIQNALSYNLKPSAKAGLLSRPVAVHRLDYSTSGLLICAKTHSAAAGFGKQFTEKRIMKTYSAIVNGATEASGEINAEVDGKEAFTSFTTLKTIPSLVAGSISLVELHPATGRKHQLRVHMSGIGHSIVGDKLYNNDNYPLLKGKGMFLCASYLSFSHPGNGRKIEISHPLPHKFISLLEREVKRYKSKNS
jgi:tRNA pseudouridine65 synthase/23S rRNA pseudouridine1911/1915/1917 synthase